MNINSNLKRVRVIETEVYSRVVGYYRPVQNWNRGKKQEFSERRLMRTDAWNRSSVAPSRNLVSSTALSSIA